MPSLALEVDGHGGGKDAGCWALLDGEMNAYTSQIPKLPQHRDEGVPV